VLLLSIKTLRKKEFLLFFSSIDLKCTSSCAKATPKRCSSSRSRSGGGIRLKYGRSRSNVTDLETFGKLHLKVLKVHFCGQPATDYFEKVLKISKSLLILVSKSQNYLPSN
jgi:hypothetical protein